MDNKDQNLNGTANPTSGATNPTEANPTEANLAAANPASTPTNLEPRKNSVLQDDWQAQLGAERAREEILRRSAAGQHGTNEAAMGPRPEVRTVPPTVEQLTAAQGKLKNELATEKKEKSLLVIIIGILGGVILIGVIIAVVVLIINSIPKNEEVVAEPTTVSCLGLEVEQKDGYTYNCKASWALTVTNTGETFGMTVRVAEGTLEDVKDEIDTMNGVWSQLGYTAGELETKTYEGERLLTMTMTKDDVQEFIVFKALGTDYILMMELTDYSGVANEDPISTALTLLKDIKTDQLAEAGSVSLKALAGQLTLLDSIATRAANDAVRRTNVDSLKAAVEQYQSDNGGKLPTDGARLIKTYLNDDFADPDGVDYTVQIDTYADDLAETGALNDYSKSYAMHMIARAKCSGENAAETDNSRNFAILYRLEGGAIYCVDNQ